MQRLRAENSQLARDAEAARQAMYEGELGVAAQEADMRLRDAQRAYGPLDPDNSTADLDDMSDDEYVPVTPGFDGDYNIGGAYSLGF